jgi:glycosyltransferase involved in cell wall biosynthesis
VNGHALLLLPGAFTGHGGIEKFNRLLIRAFAELEPSSGVRPVSLILNDAPEDIDGRYVPASADWPRAFRRSRWRFIVAALLEVLRSKPELVVLGHVHFAPLARLVLAFSPKSRIWFAVYGIDVWKPLSPSIRAGLARAEKVLSISRFSKLEVETNGSVPGEKIVLLPCALDPVWAEQYGPKKPRSLQPVEVNGPACRPSILTVARLAASERYKGIDSVLRALPGVVRQFPNVRYDIVGDGDDLPRLQALAVELGMSEWVCFHGSLWPDRLASFYQACSLFAMPSQKEGFGIVFLEAALFGKPSIAGRHGGSPEVVADGVTGTLVDCEDVQAIEGALLRYLMDPGYASAEGEAASMRTKELFLFDTFRSNLAVHLATFTTKVESRSVSGSDLSLSI